MKTDDLLRVAIVRAEDEEGRVTTRLEVWETTDLYPDGAAARKVVDEELDLARFAAVRRV